MKGVKRKPWHRLPQEGAQAYNQLFLCYLDLGADRSAAKVAERTGRDLRLVQWAMQKFDWVARVRAYDDHLVHVQQRAVERTLEQDAIKWARRRSAYRDREYELSERLRERAFEMLELSLTEEQVIEYYPNNITDAEGRPLPKTVIRKPVRWSQRDINAFADVSAKLARLSMQMETSRDNVTLDLQDPDTRLQRAREVLEKLKSQIAEWMEKYPSMTQEQILQVFVQRTATDWQIAPERLVGDDIDLLTEPPLLTEGEQ
jgi:hypothetical protein